MPLSFLVKHNATKRKPLVDRLATYSNTPESFTSRKKTAELAAEGNDIYVVEIRRCGAKTTYWLGYTFTSTRCISHPSGKWEGEFKFKNVSSPPVPGRGLYLATPVEITSASLDTWIRNTQGMRQIPAPLREELDSMFTRAGAKACA